MIFYCRCFNDTMSNEEKTSITGNFRHKAVFYPFIFTPSKNLNVIAYTRSCFCNLMESLPTFYIINRKLHISILSIVLLLIKWFVFHLWRRENPTISAIYICKLQNSKDLLSMSEVREDVWLNQYKVQWHLQANHLHFRHIYTSNTQHYVVIHKT